MFVFASFINLPGFVQNWSRFSLTMCFLIPYGPLMKNQTSPIDLFLKKKKKKKKKIFQSPLYFVQNWSGF